MKSKKIANIVFYKFYEEGQEKRRACIFYTDGSSTDVSYDEGIDACEEIVKEKHITSKEAFREMINNDIIHVTTARELEKNYDNYVINSTDNSSTLSNEEQPFVYQKNKKQNINNETDEIEENYQNNFFDQNKEKESEDTEEDKDKIEKEEDNNNFDSDEFEEIDDNNFAKNYDIDGVEDIDGLTKGNDIYNSIDDNNFDDSISDDELNDLIDDKDIELDDSTDDDLDDLIEDDDIELDDSINDDNLDDLIEDDDLSEELEESNKNKKEGFFKRIWNKITKNKFVKRLVLCVTALAIGCGLYSCSNHKSKEGKMLNSNITNDASLSNNIKTINDPETIVIYGDNDYYNNYDYNQLIEVTENKTQKSAMKRLHNTITGFNGPFATAFVEEGKSIKAALTFDEVVALQHAYNDYSDKQIKAYFNGSMIDSETLTKDYKSATLQLMGAHVIETRENQVDMSKLLVNKDEREFYNRYHEMFLDAKEATGEDQLNKIKAFYDAVKKDFPITKEVRTDGIMHRLDYDQVESYKMSVVPMIAAAEIMYQNHEINYTLSGMEIDFLNDIGYCNFAQNKYENIENITKTAEEDNKNPLYEQYRNAIIGELKTNNQYVIDDENRDLSKLDRFQNIVNWHFNIKDGVFTGSGYYSGSTTSTWSETTTTYREETSVVNKPIPESEKDKIDAEIEAENQAEKEEAEQEAEDSRQEMQEEADKEGEKIEEEIEQEKDDFKDALEDANNQIEENNKDDDPSNDDLVNEEDFGDANVDFDDDFSNENGDLDNSVENITPDGTGDQSGEKLPDPNDTGAEFDKEEPEYTEENPKEEPNNNLNNQEKESAGQTIFEYEEEITNEDLVNAYVESLANNQENTEASYEYTK